MEFQRCGLWLRAAIFVVFLVFVRKDGLDVREFLLFDLGVGFFDFCFLDQVIFDLLGYQRGCVVSNCPTS